MEKEIMTLINFDMNLDSMTEVDIWREIDYLDSLILVISCNRYYFNLSNDEYVKLNLFYQKLVYYTKKFGVTFDKEEYGDDFQISNSFKSWKMYWLKTLMGLGRDLYLSFQNRQINEEDLKEYLKDASWQEEHDDVKSKKKK